MITTKHFDKGLDRANKILVNTKYSPDGHYLESFWIDYSPEDRYALFLLEFTLKNNPMVDFYMVYDENGNRVERKET